LTNDINKKHLVVIGILVLLLAVGVDVSVKSQYKTDFANMYMLKLIRLNRMCAMIAE